MHTLHTLHTPVDGGATADDPRTMAKFRLMLMLVGSYTRFQKSNLVLLLNKKIREEGVG